MNEELTISDPFLDSIRDIMSDAAQWKAIKLIEPSMQDDRQFGELVRLAIRKEVE